MENKEFEIIVVSLVPDTHEYTGKSGGYVRLLEIIGRFKKNNNAVVKLITSSKKFACYFLEKKIADEVRKIKSNLTFKSQFGLATKSLYLVLKFLFFYNKEFLETAKSHIFYCSSDLFWDTLPVYYCRKKYKNTRWVQEIYHLYPHWRKRSGSFCSNFFGYYLQKVSLFLVKKKADQIFALSNNLKCELISMGFSENRIAVSYNGLDWEYYQNIFPADIHYDGVFLGRLSHSKGIFNLVEIWKRVCVEFPNAKLAIIGGGNKGTKAKLMQKIKNLKLDKNIDILGFLEDKKAHSLLKSAKIFLFPSYEEGFGIAIAEAMACGLPVVSWDLPVYQEIFENYTVQVEENDIEKFSSEVKKFLKNEELRSRIGLSGKEFVKKYSWDKVAKEEFNIIKARLI